MADQRTASGTVETTAPLTVTADGADTACPAEIVSGLTVSVGDRVQLQDRSPRQPLVAALLETSA